MKFKVLAYTFSIPLLWATILLLLIIAPDLDISRSFSFAVVSGLLVGSIIGRFFGNDKYVTGLTVDDEMIVVAYLTPLARPDQVIIRISSLSEIKLKKKIFLIRDFGIIKFLNKDKQITFYLLSSDAKKATERLIKTFATKAMANTT